MTNSINDTLLNRDEVESILRNMGAENILDQDVFDALIREVEAKHPHPEQHNQTQMTTVLDSVEGDILSREEIESILRNVGAEYPSHKTTLENHT